MLKLDHLTIRFSNSITSRDCCVGTLCQLAYAVLVLLLPLQVLDQSHSGFPVDILSGPPPQPMLADGRTHFLYELHLTNFAPLPIELTRFDILGDGTSLLASYRAQTLEKMVVPVEELSSPESPSASAGKRTIGEGHALMIFVDLALDPGAHPAKLRHRFFFTVTRKNGDTLERTLDGPSVVVVRQSAPVLRPPLRGSIWVAFNALGAEDHRRSLNAVDGRGASPSGSPLTG